MATAVLPVAGDGLMLVQQVPQGKDTGHNKNNAEQERYEAQRRKSLKVLTDNQAQTAQLLHSSSDSGIVKNLYLPCRCDVSIQCL